MNPKPKSYVHNIPAARGLRKSETESEQRLWDALRNRRLDGHKFRRQHAIRRFVVDFYCDDARLVVEIDGGIHLDPEQRVRDRLRQAELESEDLAFVRVAETDVLERLPAVLERIRAAIHQRGLLSTTTTPPLPQRREESTLTQRGPGVEGQCA